MSTGRKHQYPGEGRRIPGACFRDLYPGNVIMDQQQRSGQSSRQPPVYGIYTPPGSGSQHFLNIPPNNVQNQNQQQSCANCNVGIGQLMETFRSFIVSYKEDMKQVFDAIREIKECAEGTSKRVIKVEEITEGISERVTRVEESVARGWADVYDYSGGDSSGTVPRTASSSPTFIRRDCNPVTEMSGTISGSNNNDNTIGSSSIPAENISHAEPPGMAYPTSYGGELIIETDNVPASSASATLITSPISRRQSNTASTTTNESGYADDPFNTGSDSADDHHYEQGGGHITESVDRNITNESVRTGTVIVSTGVDEDIEILNEITVIPTKSKSEVLDAGPVSSGKRKKENYPSSQKLKSNERIRKSSVFSSVERRRTSLYFDDMSDDENNATTNSQSISSPLDPEISNLNGIFEYSGESASNDDNFPSSSQQTKRKRTSTNPNSTTPTKKRILGISKAPIKQEPVSLSIGESPRDCNVIPSPSQPSSSTSLDRTATEFSMETLRKIKKERKAHALESSKADRNGDWWCICGHSTKSRSGMQAHVKYQGTEEPRYKCPLPLCNERFIYPYRVKEHLIKQHGETQDIDVFACEKCYGIFCNKTELNTHINKRGEPCKISPRRSKSNREEAPPEQRERIPEASTRTENPSIIINL